MESVSLETIIHGDFESVDHVLHSFRPSKVWSDGGDYRFASAPIEESGLMILFASYDNGSYSGAAFVLVMRDGLLFEVNGSHCSCHGLEDQWDEEETDVASLRHRMQNGSLGWSDHWDYDKGRSEKRDEFASILESQLQQYVKYVAQSASKPGNTF